jgi:CrcB protein
VITVGLFALLAGAGATTRALATSLGNRPGSVPLGTLAVNIAGCLLLGALHGGHLAPPALTVLGTGMVGALTTFSGFAADTTWLASGGRRGLAAAYVALSLVAGVAAAAVGSALAG